MNHWHDNGIYVAGLMRSGTTMLLSLLDGHPDLLVYPTEPSFTRLFKRPYQSAHHMIDDFIYGTPNSLHLNKPLMSSEYCPTNFFTKTGSKDFMIPPDFSIPAEAKNHLIDKLNLREFGREILDQLVDMKKYHQLLEDHLLAMGEEISPRRAVLESLNALLASLKFDLTPTGWVFKQPTGHLNSAQIQWFFDHFPDGKCLFIIRDPRGQYNSHKKHARTSDFHKERLITQVGYIVNRTNLLARNYQEICQLREAFGADQAKFVYYEDILLRPRELMEEIADFLGVRFDPILMQPTFLGHPVSVGTARAGYGTRIEPELGAAWKRDVSALEIGMIEGQLKSYFQRPDVPYEMSEKVHMRLLGQCMTLGYQALTGIKGTLRL